MHHAALSLLMVLVLAVSAVTSGGRVIAQEATPVTAPAATPDATPLSDIIERQPFTVDFGGFEAAAELTYPVGERGPFPTVILIPGSGAADMDFTLRDFATGEIRSTIFRDIAEYLSARGYAVARYNKHYVGGPDDIEGQQVYVQNFTFDMLLADAQSVYETVRAMPQVDPERIALYGWSEGSIIATQLAIMEPAIAALILHGPVTGRFQDVFAYQSRELAVEFLSTVADTNDDGKISLEELFAAYDQYPGTVASLAILTTLDRTSTFEAPKLNVAMDADGDGQLDSESEMVPFLEDFFTSFDEMTEAGRSPYGPQYTTGQQLPTILDSIGEILQPVLILQGENDANVPPADAARLDAALDEAGHPDHTLIVYPGLGHSLGPAPTLYEDNYTPIAEAPLADAVAWLDDHLGG
jgi:dipeptidyl aminopeptidase/acylaminoacyl peptidase